MNVVRSIASMLVIAMVLSPTYGQESSELEQVTVALPDQEFGFKLIRLPRVNDIAPLVTGDTEQKSGFTTVASYLCETEISLATVKATLSQSSWERYVARVLSLTGTDDDPKWGPYRKFVREGSREYPAIYLGISEIVEICTKLDLDANFAGSAFDREMEELSFRVPSRIEWQFAARAITDKSSLQAKLHFDRWADYSLVLEGKIKDIQSKIGDPPDAAAVADQGRLISLISRAMQRDDTRNEASELLGEILQGSVGFEPNIGKAEEANLLPVASTQPNAWGFQRMLGNAPEWVITADTSKMLDDLWSTLKDQDFSKSANLGSTGDRKFGILMGGNFVSLANRTDKWLDYSINGGNPVSASAPDSTPEPKPYLVIQCVGDDAEGVEDGHGGLRLIMVRGLAQKWLVPFRQKTFLASDGDADRIADQTLQVMKEILPDKEYEKNARMVTVYRELSTDKENFSDASWQRALQEVGSIDFGSSDNKASEKAPSAGLSALLAIAGDSKPNSAAEKSPSSARANFFEIALQLAEAESKAGN